MQVLFLKDVSGVALAGEIKDVKSGFARNHLLPKNLATAALSQHTKNIDKIKKDAEKLRIAELEDVTKLASAIDGTEITLTAKVSPSGEYYGTIGPSQISEGLSSTLERTIERHLIQLDEPIKTPGTYEIDLRLHQGVHAKVSVIAEAEE